MMSGFKNFVLLIHDVQESVSNISEWIRIFESFKNILTLCHFSLSDLKFLSVGAQEFGFL